MPRNTTLDNPGERKEDDEFDRWKFSERLAQTIVDFDTSQGAPVIGIYGSWGSGKSTVLNFVQQLIDEKHKEKVRVLAFNPWLTKDPAQLLMEFFGEIAREIRAGVKTKKEKLGQFLSNYGGALSSLPFGSGAAKTAENLGKQMSQVTIQDQRDRIKTAMQELKFKLVILIDDLDRLDRDEIMTVLKVVRLAGNFPNIVYLLAFDEERVARVAATTYGEAGGRQFLEKIVQYPFTLPAISSNQLVDYVLRHARDACTSAEIVLSDELWQSFEKICQDALRHRLNTPRQAIRYANALRFALPIIKNIADPYLHLLIEAARVLYYDLYAAMREHQHLLENRDSLIMAAWPDEIERAKRPSDELEFVSELTKAALRIAPFRTGRRSHQRYFSYSINPTDVNEIDAINLMEFIYESDSETNVNHLKSIDTKRLSLILEILLDFLISDGPYSRKLALEKVDKLALCLCKHADIFEESIDNNPRIFKLLDQVVAQSIFYEPYLRKIKGQITFDVFRTARPIPFAISTYFELARVAAAYERDAVGTRLAGSLEIDWTNLRKIIVERVVEEIADDAPYLKYNKRDALTVLKFWRDTDNSTEPDWIGARLADHPEDCVPFLGMWSDVTVTVIYDFVGNLASPDLLAKAIHTHFGERLLDENATTDGLSAARSFLDAYEKRQRTEAASAAIPITPYSTP